MKFIAIEQLKSLNPEKARAIVQFEVEEQDSPILQQVVGSDLSVTFEKETKEVNFFNFFNHSKDAFVPVGLSDENKSKLTQFLQMVTF